MKRLFLLFACFIMIQAMAQDNSKDRKSMAWCSNSSEKFQDEKNWTATEQGIVGDHFQRLIKKKDEGIIVFAGRTELSLNNPEMMGLVVFYAKDEKEALQFMREDPAVKNKIMLAKVHPYGLAVSKCQ